MITLLTRTRKGACQLDEWTELLFPALSAATQPVWKQISITLAAFAFAIKYCDRILTQYWSFLTHTVRSLRRTLNILNSTYPRRGRPLALINTANSWLNNKSLHGSSGHFNVLAHTAGGWMGGGGFYIGKLNAAYAPLSRRRKATSLSGRPLRHRAFPVPFRSNSPVRQTHSRENVFLISYYFHLLLTYLKYNLTP